MSRRTYRTPRDGIGAALLVLIIIILLVATFTLIDAATSKNAYAATVQTTYECATSHKIMGGFLGGAYIGALIVVGFNLWRDYD